MTGHSLTPDEYKALFGALPTHEPPRPTQPPSPPSYRLVDVRPRSELDDAMSTLRRGDRRRTSDLRPAIPRSATVASRQADERHPLVWAALAGGAACVVLGGLLIASARREEPTRVQQPEEVIFPAVPSDVDGVDEP